MIGTSLPTLVQVTVVGKVADIPVRLRFRVTSVLTSTLCTLDIVTAGIDRAKLVAEL